MPNNLSVYFRALCVSVLILSITTVFSQEMNNNWFLDAGARGGGIAMNFHDPNLFKTNIFGLDVRIGKQTFGKKEWEQWHKYPSYGLMIRYGKFNNPRLDQKMALLFFMNGDIVRRGWFSLKYELAAGLAFWFNPYDVDTNPENTYIGSVVTCHLNMSFSANFEITKNLDLIFRGSFSHSSNGVLKLPNSGINMASADLALRYYFKNRAEKIVTIDTIRNYSPVNHFMIYYSPGACKSRKLFNPPDKISEKLFFTSTFKLAYCRQSHPVFRYGGGVDLMFNTELINHLPEDLKHNKHCFSVGIFTSLEIVYGRLILGGDIGTYLYRAYKFSDPIYERFGFKFLCDKQKRLFFGVSLKAHAARAESIEWIVGYHIVSKADKKFSRRIKTLMR